MVLGIAPFSCYSFASRQLKLVFIDEKAVVLPRYPSHVLTIGYGVAGWWEKSYSYHLYISIRSIRLFRCTIYCYNKIKGNTKLSHILTFSTQIFSLSLYASENLYLHVYRILIRVPIVLKIFHFVHKPFFIFGLIFISIFLCGS